MVEAEKEENKAENGYSPRMDSKTRRIGSSIINMEELRKLSWLGIPEEIPRLRCQIWKLLLGYLPNNKSVQKSAMKRKREEYSELVELYFGGEHECSEDERKSYKQILADVPRTMPEYPIFSITSIKEALIRILYIWSMRHPTSRYVQGINDLCAPFLLSFLGAHADMNPKALLLAHTEDLSIVDKDQWLEVEADSYWSLCKVIDRIQNFYTDEQPGLLNMLAKLQLIVRRIDAPLFTHLEENQIDFIKFGFRWVNCFLMREFTLDQIIRMWDTYLAQTDGFAVFHAYVCSALLFTYKDEIIDMDFQTAILFLQNLPTKDWSEDDIRMLMAMAYQYMSLFHNSNHLNCDQQLNKPK